MDSTKCGLNPTPRLRLRRLPRRALEARGGELVSQSSAVTRTQTEVSPLPKILRKTQIPTQTARELRPNARTNATIPTHNGPGRGSDEMKKQAVLTRIAVVGARRQLQSQMLQPCRSAHIWGRRGESRAWEDVRAEKPSERADRRTGQRGKDENHHRSGPFPPGAGPVLDPGVWTGL